MCHTKDSEPDPKGNREPESCRRVSFNLFIYLTTLHSLWDLSSLTKD